MTLKNTTERYGLLSMGMHWLMLILIVAVYACIELRVLFPKGSDPREAIKAWHFMLGMLVFLLVLGRIALRLASTTPAITPESAPWQQRLAGLMHLMLYALMVVMPLAGWLALSAAGKPIPFFGLQLPPLTGEDKALAEAIKEFHEIVGTAGYFLIGLHALAGLFHHYVARDNTLTRMLPARG